MHVDAGRNIRGVRERDADGRRRLERRFGHHVFGWDVDNFDDRHVRAGLEQRVVRHVRRSVRGVVLHQRARRSAVREIDVHAHERAHDERERVHCCWEHRERRGKARFWSFFRDVAAPGELVREFSCSDAFAGRRRRDGLAIKIAVSVAFTSAITFAVARADAPDAQSKPVAQQESFAVAVAQSV